MSKKFKQLIAFTLAEVLITLGIIGIVAAYTIPTLMHSYDKSQYVVGLKKVYSLTNIVLKQMAADNGCTENLECTGLFATGTTHQSLGDEFVKYFKVAKNCGVAAGQGCWSAITKVDYVNGDRHSPKYDSYPQYKFVTTDGMSFLIGNNSDNCQTNLSKGILGNMSKVCGYLQVDVNGLKGPNTFGRDTFALWITNGKGALLYPTGGVDDNSDSFNNWSKVETTNGMYVTGSIVENGWQMTY